MKLRLLIDSFLYIKSNCYQHQLLRTLELECESITVSTIDEIVASQAFSIEHDEKVLSCLKLRTLYNNLSHIKKFLNDKEIYIYEQDPWESFKDNSPYKGAYQKIFSTLKVISFLNTSKWWSDFINSQGIKSKFVKMWMLPEYCDSSPPWHEREIDVGFCGQLHPYRKSFFDYLDTQGIKVKILDTSSYQNFLTNLSKIKIFVHNEQVEWKINGKIFPANALWIKDVEAAARGCISMRDYEEESKNYIDDKISTILTYHNFADAAQTINRLLANDKKIQHQIDRSVQTIRDDLGWKTVLKAIE
jgi:hypothetical protein